MESETIKTIENKIKDLPTLPAVAFRIFEISNNPDTTVEELKSIISTDPVVSVRILKTVNSAYFGFPHQIDSLSKAIVLLGFNNVRALTLSVSIMGMYHGKDGAARLNYQELWKHAVGTAFASRALALNVLPRFADQCFAAGLLHDIGILIIDQCFPSEYFQARRFAGQNNTPLHEAEQKILGYTHTEVGKFIAEKWLMPATLSEAIACHHEPALATDQEKFTLVTHTADIITRMRGFGGYGDNPSVTLQNLHPNARAFFHVGDDFPANILESVEIELKEAERLMQYIH